MGLKRCLLACLLAFGGAGTAMAMDGMTQDPTATHASLDGATREGGSTSHDATGASRDRGLPGSSDDCPDAGDSGNGGSTPRAHAGQHSLGWQSLLPGSIQ